MTVFSDVNVSVYGNTDVLKCTFTFKCVLLQNQKCNYFNHLLYIAALYLLFIPVSFIKFSPLKVYHGIFYKILERSCFKRRRRKVANHYMSRDCTSYCSVLHVVIVNSLEQYDEKGVSETQT